MPENRTYSEADLAAQRKEWEQERTQLDIARQIAGINGQIAALPVTMEAIARRVVAEVVAEQRASAIEHRAQTDERHWSRLPAVVQVIQLLVAIAAIAAAYFVGKGGVP